MRLSTLLAPALAAFRGIGEAQARRMWSQPSDVGSRWHHEGQGAGAGWLPNAGMRQLGGETPVSSAQHVVDRITKRPSTCSLFLNESFAIKLLLTIVFRGHVV